MTSGQHRRYLIMTASIGSGHIQAAEAITREVRRLDPDAIIEIVDFMSRGVSTLHWLVKRIYLLMLLNDAGGKYADGKGICKV